jgi:hypothetical protein
LAFHPPYRPNLPKPDFSGITEVLSIFITRKE